jgi:hypothetical protein
VLSCPSFEFEQVIILTKLFFLKAEFVRNCLYLFQSAGKDYFTFETFDEIRRLPHAAVL